MRLWARRCESCPRCLLPPRPSEEMVKMVLSRACHPDDQFTTSILRHWCMKHDELLAEHIKSLLIKNNSLPRKRQRWAWAPPRRTRGRGGGCSAGHHRAGFGLTLPHSPQPAELQQQAGPAHPGTDPRAFGQPATQPDQHQAELYASTTLGSPQLWGGGRPWPPPCPALSLASQLPSLCPSSFQPDPDSSGLAARPGKL